MQDLHERMRRYHEHVIARSGRAMTYWDKVPPHRLGHELLEKCQAMIDALTGVKGSAAESSLDLGLLCFLLFDKGPEIAEVMTRINKSQATETTVEEHDPEREEWERKRSEGKGNEDWRG